MSENMYPRDKFEQEFSEVWGLSGRPSMRQIQDIVCKFMENPDHIVSSPALFPIAGYIRARIIANDIPLIWITGFSFKKPAPDALLDEDLKLEVELDSRYQYLCHEGKIQVVSKVPDFSPSNIPNLAEFMKEAFRRSVKNMLRIKIGGKTFKLSDVAGMEFIVVGVDRGRYAFEVHIHLGSGNSKAVQIDPIEDFRCTGW